MRARLKALCGNENALCGRCYGQQFLCIRLDLFWKMDGLTDISPGSLRAQLGEKYAAHGDVDASSILEDILRYVLFKWYGYQVLNEIRVHDM